MQLKMERMIACSFFDKEIRHVDFMYFPPTRKKLFFDRQNPDHPISIFTDRCLGQVVNSKSKYNIALIIESPGIFDFNKVKQFESHFDLILCLSTEKWTHYFPGSPGTFIKPKDMSSNHPKPKLISMILSYKRTAAGHKLRHEVAGKFKWGKEHLFGSGGNVHLSYKGEALIPYAFTVVVPNANHPGYFSDHVLDPLLTGTVPVLIGCCDLSKFFDTRGFLFSLDEEISFDRYHSMKVYIEKNFELAQKMILEAEEKIAEKIISACEMREGQNPPKK